MTADKSGLYGTLRRLWTFGRRYSIYLIITVVAMILSNIASFLRPYILKRLTDDILTGQSLDGKTAWLCVLLAGVLGATVLKGLFTFVQTNTLNVATQGTIRDLRDRLFDHFLRLPIQWFESHSVGDLIVRFNDDLRVIIEFSAGGLSTLVGDAFVLTMSVGWMAYTDWQLTILGMVVTPAAGLIVRRFATRMSHATETAQKTLSDLSSVVKETVEGIKVVKSFNQEHHEATRFSERSRESFRWAMRMVQLTATQSPLLEVLATLGIAVVLWYCAVHVMTGQLTLGDLFAFWGYMLMATTPINRLGATMTLVTRGCTATNRVFEILDTPAQENPSVKLPELPGVQGRIEFRDVRFRYTEGRPEALRGVSFTIEAGQHIAVVGRNGAGKSTLANLLPRFYEPQGGEILIDGHRIDRFSLASLRRQIALVPQETFLFSGTVRDNIAYGCSEASDERIESAARAAGAHEFILQMDVGYKTLLQENGRNLSGGQRQRLAIARMVLRDPAIVILDEATSSLDPEAERAIHDTLQRVTRGKTVINIVHRLALAQSADRIIVLDQGQVVEEDTHQALMDRQGLYYSLYSPLLETAVAQ